MPAHLETRPLGKNGPSVPRLGFGTMGLSAFYGPPKPDGERLALLDKAYELGETFWDSAALYGDSETLLGTWLRANPSKRAHVFLATKFGAEFVDGAMIIDSSRDRCLSSCERSLQRLGVATIDLLYAHRLDPAVPVEETVRAMAELRAAGKIKHLGLSEVSAATLRRAHRVHPIAAVQVEYSPFALEIESPQTDLLRTARELGVAVVAYSPLSRGILTGRVRSRADFPAGDIRLVMPRYSEENFGRNLALVERLKGFADEKGCTVGQLVLAWLLAQGEDVFPIPGTTRPEALVENVGALGVRLEGEEVARIRAVVDEVEVLGGRYGVEALRSCFVDTVPLE
ncbi:Aldo/keto reductase [Aspergillus fijiensis CBS 313.89]|uniref:Aldo/keto reductase n=1 Tax=Aspergillus fijiensis CBS 313.89 TaxID=1448319 RepID=A0A8G1RQ23_9EURO|nr:Aldo/keto reductase [Aspergillus fijiensis CBS 313.89]RAK77375.1 Aldo/keto reductase [Aspergillus fijiensis CBS 313.89]